MIGNSVSWVKSVAFIERLGLVTGDNYMRKIIKKHFKAVCHRS